MVAMDYYATVGSALQLLAQSSYHKKFPVGSYLRTEILPAIWANQVRLYVSAEQRPSAIVTWAWLTEETERDVLATGRALSPTEWMGGDRLFFNDWITPYGNIRKVMWDMTHTVFPNEVGTSLRRNPDGSIRRINRWTGVNLRSETEKKTA